MNPSLILTWRLEHSRHNATMSITICPTRVVLGLVVVQCALLNAIFGEQQGSGTRTFTNSIQMTFVEIKPGEFIMGSPANEPDRGDDETEHRVKISKRFMLGVHEVTKGQFAAFVKDTAYKTDAEKLGLASAWTGKRWDIVKGASWRNPGFEQEGSHPVIEVSWSDAIAFVVWLSRKEAKNYRLPSEAEWEYACRSGSATAYYWGDDPDDGKGWLNGAGLEWKEKLGVWGDWEGFSWRDNYAFTSPVGSFKPNAWGLYDMLGNVWEWCQDRFAEYPKTYVVDPKGSESEDDSDRVLRGGGLDIGPPDCRAANRFTGAADFRDCTVGFRVVLE